jgi:peptidoglycan hydrolase CwlO-like protein
MIGRPHERTSAPHRRRTRGAAALAGAIVAVLLPTTTTGNGPGVTPWSATTAAAASDLTAARQRAAELRREIPRLELAADVAVEDYLTVADQLDRATSAYVSASRVLGAARSASDEAELAAGRRARALYIAGGPVALYASVLTGADMREVMDRAQTVQRLIQADQSMVSAQHQVVASGAAIADRLERLAGRRTRSSGRQQPLPNG